jgi:hypothetical protein
MAGALPERNLMLTTLQTLLMATSLITPAAEAVPNFDPRVTCKADASAQNGVPQQNAAQCLADEDAARTKVRAQWANFNAPLQSRCAAETHIDGSPSYVELLVCLRIGAGLNPQ